jgi:hypothetical protein
MDEFLSALISYFHAATLMPAEVLTSDTDREKTYQVDLPATPNNVVCMINYRTEIGGLGLKEVGVKRIQIIVRNDSQKVAFNIVNSVYLHLLQLTGNITDISVKYFGIFDVKAGPVNAGMDTDGRHLWSLSFPVKVNLY